MSYWNKNKARQDQRYGGGKARYRKRRGGRGGISYRKSKGNFDYWDVGDKLWNNVKRLKGLINTEFKKINVTAAATVSTTASIIVINPSVMGDDFDSRDGRVIRLKSVQLTLTAAIGATTTFSFVRVMVVIDKQPNEISMVITNLLDFANITSHRNLDGRKRFVILKDKILELSQVGKRTGIIKWYKELDMKTIYDDSNTGTIVDITTNTLYLVLISDEASLVPFVTRTTRVRFIDN